MPANRQQSDIKQAFRCFCLYALSCAGFLYFWAATVFGQLPAGVMLWLSIGIWIGAGLLALHAHLWMIDRNSWTLVPFWVWARARRETLVTAFILWNISNVVVLGLDAALRMQGTISAAYPWFMFLSIGMAYGVALFLCGSLATARLDHLSEKE